MNDIALIHLSFANRGNKAYFFPFSVAVGGGGVVTLALSIFVLCEWKKEFLFIGCNRNVKCFSMPLKSR